MGFPGAGGDEEEQGEMRRGSARTELETNGDVHRAQM